MFVVPSLVERICAPASYNTEKNQEPIPEENNWFVKIKTDGWISLHFTVSYVYHGHKHLYFYEYNP